MALQSILNIALKWIKSPPDAWLDIEVWFTSSVAGVLMHPANQIVVLETIIEQHIIYKDTLSVFLHRLHWSCTA